jgi:collagenase-like PrtC family protease
VLSACSAANFSVEELPEVMGYLRARGVKGYVALNILVSNAQHSVPQHSTACHSIPCP